MRIEFLEGLINIEDLVNRPEINEVNTIIMDYDNIQLELKWFSKITQTEFMEIQSEVYDQFLMEDFNNIMTDRKTYFRVFFKIIEFNYKHIMDSKEIFNKCRNEIKRF